MKLYIIRHAPALERHIFAQNESDDSLRPITDKGIERMQETLKVLTKTETHIDLVLQSPYKRCVETGKIIKQFYPQAIFKKSEFLKPDHSAQSLYDFIFAQKVESIALVGHEPDLGQFISWLLFRQATDCFPLKKAGIAKMDLYQDGRAYLKWMLHPKMVTK